MSGGHGIERAGGGGSARLTDACGKGADCEKAKKSHSLNRQGDFLLPPTDEGRLRGRVPGLVAAWLSTPPPDGGRMARFRKAWGEMHGITGGCSRSRSRGIPPLGSQPAPISERQKWKHGAHRLLKTLVKMRAILISVQCPNFPTKPALFKSNIFMWNFELF